MKELKDRKAFIEYPNDMFVKILKNTIQIKNEKY